MNTLTTFCDRFFSELELKEDLENGHSYKSYLRGAVRTFLESETQDNAFQVYRAFFDAYRITIPGKSDPFVDLVDILRNYEKTAATLIDKQRDHFIHSVNVFLTGLSIYIENPAFRKAFAAAIPEPGFTAGFSTKHEEFFFRWGIASLFHDVGYPVEIVGHQINRFIRMVADADGDEIRVKAQIRYENFAELNHIREIVPKREFTKSYYDAYESCSYVDLLTPLDLLAHRIHQCFRTDLSETKAHLNRFVDLMAASGFIDHGYYSAIILLKWYGFALQQSGEKPDRFFWQVVDAATAIILHNYFRNSLQKPPFSLPPMTAEQNPIAYLLILCDELQEWNREAHGILTRTFTKADTVHLSLKEDYLSATYFTKQGHLPDWFCDEKIKLIRSELALEPIFPKDFLIDAASLDAIAPLRPVAAGIVPRPLLENIELLAIAIHARYNEKQLADHPDQPLAYPSFTELPDDLKYSNMRQAMDICDHLGELGYALKPAGAPGAITAITGAELEYLAEREHEAWMNERISRGWTPGPRDPERKTSPYLIPYAELSEEIKDYDRDAVRNIPALAARIGMAVYAI